MESCDCIDFRGHHDELLLKYQLFSDVLIALAYFSIPLELIYFVQRAALFPYRWVLLQFGAFIVLCGATHFISLWTYTMHCKAVAIVMTIAKVLCAAVSCITALMLVHIIPDLLSVKTREFLLKSRAEELDREMGIILTQEETGRHVRMLTHEIRSKLDRHSILKTTLVKLGSTLKLEECALWMPSRNDMALQLSHALNYNIQVAPSISMNLPIVHEVFNTHRAVRIPFTCPLARIRPLTGRYVQPEVVAVRVPLLHHSNFQINDWPDLSARSYAIMILILPTDSARVWRDHELELVEVVADQLFPLLKSFFLASIWNVGVVAVALSHAAILEESTRARDQLMKQNVDLDMAQREAELAIHARNDFLSVMNHEMRTPTHAIISLSSLFMETELTPQQRIMTETVLKSSNLLATLINDVLDISRLEDGSLELDIGIFNLHDIFREVMDLMKPIASAKKLLMNLSLSSDLPKSAIGDEKRVMQIMLNIVGNAVKFTKEGNVLIMVSVAKPDSFRDWRPPEFYPVSTKGHFHLCVQVKDSGCGVLPQDIPNLFTKFTQRQSGSSPCTGLGLAISRRFVNLMGGGIWLESEGLNKGTIATFIVKLGTLDPPSCPSLCRSETHAGPYHGSSSLSGMMSMSRETDGHSDQASNAPRYQRSF